MALASSLIRAFGGVQRLTILFRQAVESALAAHPTSASTAMMLLAVLKLRITGESLPLNDILPETLERMRTELADQLSSLIISRPDELAGLLKEIGWRVERPAGT